MEQITNDEVWALVLFHADNDPKIVRQIENILITSEIGGNAE